MQFVDLVLHQVEDLLTEWRLRRKILLEIQQVQNIQGVITINVKDLESNLVLVHLVVLVNQWVEPLYHLQEINLLPMLTTGQKEIEKLTEVRALVSEDPREVLDDVFLLNIYLIFGNVLFPVLYLF